MVVFIDYDHEATGKHGFPKGPGAFAHAYVEPGDPVLAKLRSVGLDLPSSTDIPTSDALPPSPTSKASNIRDDNHPQGPNWNGFSAALSCYPIAKEIARSIDLNTLHALSGTCRQFHVNLAPYRQQLGKQTLRCENEYIETLSEMLHSGTAIPDSVKSVIRIISRSALSSGQLTSGKISKCARDMVAECRGCSKIVCRNCTAKPPSGAILKNRIRRLCTTCRTVPLNTLITPSSYPSQTPMLVSDRLSHASPVPLRDICTCEDGFWLCHQCGHRLRRSDVTYRRVWTWRTRYSTYLGGLGTGIGEGCQGVKCGREENCLGAQEIELEVECDADDSLSSSSSEHGYNYHHHHYGNRHEHSPVRSHNNTTERWEQREEEEPGYFRQEIIGIGGVVKQKAKKRVLLGACVVEHEDERETGEYLTREEEGVHRSWCGWCWRVIPGKDEKVTA